MTRAEAIAYRGKIETAASTMTDEAALTAVELFPAWEVGKAYAINDRVQYNGTLYKCIQAHTSQSDWAPSATPALWKVVSVDEYPEWVQPTGAHDAYNIGDKVTYNGKHYVCTSNANVYAPDVYGWELET
jgi:chitodextrinase